MLCPNGCDVPGERYRSPVNVPHVGLVRRHRCPNCRRIFMSLQKVISNWAAEKILLRLEEQDGTSSERPTDSSENPSETSPLGEQPTPTEPSAF